MYSGTTEFDPVHFPGSVVLEIGVLARGVVVASGNDRKSGIPFQNYIILLPWPEV